jgi:thiamine-monophosphate kinase
VTEVQAGTGEFDLIARIRQRAATRADVVLGIGDDAALLQPPPGQQLVVAMDTLNAGVHFPEDTAPADIGWKALAVNLSDLAAMGATPAWCTLSLSLPRSDAAWVDAFLDGFLGLAQLHGVALVGGDTTRGPLSVSVTVHGFVAPGRALRRDAARAGDEVWVTGTLGDAAAALAQWRAAVEALARNRAADPQENAAVPRRDTPDALAAAALRTRLDRPTPRIAAGRALAGLAHAGIDISDGLLADLGHVLRASGVGATLELTRLPASDALRAAFADDAARWCLQAAGGDDYELCFTAPVSAHDAVAAALAASHTAGDVIGRIDAAPGLRVLAPGGHAWSPPRAGYEHFGAAAD